MQTQIKLSRLLGYAPGQCYGHNYKPCTTPIKCTIGAILSKVADTITHFNIWLFKKPTQWTFEVHNTTGFYLSITRHSNPSDSWYHIQRADTFTVVTIRSFSIYKAKRT